MRIKDKILVLVCCYNRSSTTERAISTLEESVPTCSVNLDIVALDDCSTDDTVTRLKKYDLVQSVHISEGDLFWAGGMARIYHLVRDQLGKYDFVLCINDDCEFDTKYMQEFLLSRHENYVLVGSVKDKLGNIIYGGQKLYRRFTRPVYKRITSLKNMSCDAFNMNCVLFPVEIINKYGFLDSRFIHSFADFHYSERLIKAGVQVKLFPEPIATGSINGDEGTSRDASLPLKRRLQLLLGPKEEPFKARVLKCKYQNPKTWCFHVLTPYLKLLFLHVMSK